MRDRLIELLTDNLPRCGNLPHWDNPLQLSCDEQVERIADHLLASGVIVPPCKVGDTVYYVSFGKVYKGKCHAITLKPTMQIHLYDYDGDNASYSSKDVFLTKEEAERALKEREQVD